jgi:hypothetical protein
MKHQTPEDEFNAIIDAIETRAMEADGPVTPTLQEATEDELSRLWELVNEISPKRKALARKQLKGTATDAECDEYLRQEGIDPEEIGRQGVVFVKTLSAKIKMEQALSRIANCNDLATAREYAREVLAKEEKENG